MNKDEKSTTLESPWWEKRVELQHVRIIDELETKNWRNPTKGGKKWTKRKGI